MPPAASDDLIRQQSRSLEDEISFDPDQTRIIPEHESSGSKGKKKKNSKKAKAAARAVTETETPPGDVYVTLWNPQFVPLGSSDMPIQSSTLGAFTSRAIFLSRSPSGAPCSTHRDIARPRRARVNGRQRRH